MIPEEIESILSARHRGLVGALLKPQFTECLIQQPYGFLVFPSCRGKDEDVVHVPEVLHVEIPNYSPLVSRPSLGSA